MMEEKEIKEKTKKKKKRAPLVISIIMCVVMIVAIVVILAVTGRSGKRRENEPDTSMQIETQEPEPVYEPPFNFVMFGIDDIGYTPWDIDRSDMIMIVSIDEAKQQIHLISILRDTRVPIEGLEPQKINKAYQEGRHELALKTINDAFHTDFDQYLTLNWQDVVFLIDDIGGVDVEITDEEAEKINQMVSSDISREGRNAYCEDVWGGVAHLDGTQAVHFSRIRSIDSDYDRAWRQQRTLKAIQQKVRTLSIDDLPALADFLMENTVETNLSVSDVMHWINKGVVGYEITSAVIPDWSYEHDIFGGIDEDTEQWVWIYDLEEGAARLHSIIDK